MSNGFKALRHVGGGVQRLSAYPIKTGYGVSIFNGDIVEIKTDAGFINRAAPTGAAQNSGVFVGVSYVNARGEQKFSPVWEAGTVGTDIQALVSGDNEVSYAVTSDVATQAKVGASCDFVAGAGNISTGQSGMSVAVGAGTATIRSILNESEKLVEVVLKSSLV